MNANFVFVCFLSGFSRYLILLRVGFGPREFHRKEHVEGDGNPFYVFVLI